MKHAVHFGAGNIGRGFIGNLLSQSGYRVVFADVNTTIIEALAAAGRYTVEEVGNEKREIVVEPVSGILSDDPALIDAIADADLITTAVGPKVLPIIAAPIAAGIARRRTRGTRDPLNIIACENMIRASSALQVAVIERCDDQTRDYVSAHVGFPDSAVDRIVPPMPRTTDPLLVRVEEFCEWIVDRLGFVGEVPPIAQMQLVDDLDAYIERKLFTLNTGHAVAAYLGAGYGHATIGDAMYDPRVAHVVRGAMFESGEVLIRRYRFDRQAHEAYIEKVIARFHNPYLVDEVVRVGRQPIRKIGPSERIMKPILGTAEYELPRTNLLTGAAALFAFRSPEDEEAEQIAAVMQQEGVRAAVARFVEVPDPQFASQVADEIATAFESFQARSIVDEYVRRWTHVVTVREAQREFLSLVEEAIAGKDVIVARDGRPVVRITTIGAAD